MWVFLLSGNTIKTSAGYQAFTNQALASKQKQCDYPVKDEIVLQKISIHRMWAFLLHLQAEESSIQKINGYISVLFHRQNSITKRLNDQQHLLRLRSYDQGIRADRSGAFIYMLSAYPKEETQGAWSIGDKTFRKTCKQIRHALDSWWNRVRASFI